MTSTERTVAPAELPDRGFLLHITHYDPRWWESKATEQPFDLDVGLEVIDAMADVGLNLLVIDCADGLHYASHPELARPYSVPMQDLRVLVERAQSHAIEVVPKLNFAQSGLHRHNDWFRPHNDLFDSPRYWELAFELIDELIAEAKPPRFFHVGMDEDHWRSYTQYVAAIQTLHAGLEARGLRAVIWNDSACMWPQAEIHRDKSLAAEQTISGRVVQVLWDYNGVNEAALRRIRDGGFELWGAPGRDPEGVILLRKTLETIGATGILLTRWIPCVAANREQLLSHIRTLGPLCRQALQ
jgi:hypothetical protein